MAAYHFAMLFVAANSGRKGYIRYPSDNIKFLIFETHWMYMTLTLCNLLDFTSVVYTNCARSDIVKATRIGKQLASQPGTNTPRVLAINFWLLEIGE